MRSWINTLRAPAEDLGSLAENEPSTGYEPNDHFLTETYVEYTQESSGEQRYPDDFDYDDIAIGKTLLDSTRAEDKSITLKKKACRPVCRRQSVIIERGDPLFAPVSSAQKKLREIPLRVMRLGHSWSDKESKYSRTVKQRYENTNSNLITTEEVFKN